MSCCNIMIVESKYGYRFISLEKGVELAARMVAIDHFEQGYYDGDEDVYHRAMNNDSGKGTPVWDFLRSRTKFEYENVYLETLEIPMTNLSDTENK